MIALQLLAADAHPLSRPHQRLRAVQRVCCIGSHFRPTADHRPRRLNAGGAASRAAKHMSSNHTRAPVRCSSHAVATAVAAAWSSEGIFVASTLYCMPLCFLIALAPKWRTAYRLTLSDSIFVPLALAYVVLLLRSWQPDTLSLMMPGSLADGFAGGRVQVQWIPKLAGIQQLFSRTPTAASLWVHLLAINVFAARWIMLDGLRYGVVTLHSVLVAAVFGPLGVCSHFLTQVLFGRGASAVA